MFFIGVENKIQFPMSEENSSFDKVMCWFAS